jgi:Ca2+-transporting ATPase
MSTSKGLPAGLSSEEAAARYEQYGPNTLPDAKTPSVLQIFLRQFLNPLIYILVVAAAVSLALDRIEDSVFILIVLLINGAIGTAQEYSAGRAAIALRKLEQHRAMVIRDGMQRETDAAELVPGDLILLEAGNRVPADAQLVEAFDLQCDESLLTGESAPVKKSADARQGEQSLLGRKDVAFAGSTITRGRGRATVTATGLRTQIGKIAEQIARRSISEPPLMLRIRRFSRNVALAMLGAIVLLVAAGLFHNVGLQDLFLMSVGLAVAAIPEGLPIAISIALAIGMRRMARTCVIVRNLPAVESLGSCTMIATDKTGTLTLNELAVTDISLPDGTDLTCEYGQGASPPHIHSPAIGDSEVRFHSFRLFRAAALANEGQLIVEEKGWSGFGDTVDVALLAAARGAGITSEDIRRDYPLIRRVPYEPDRKYAASFHEHSGKVFVYVKGAVETLVTMASHMKVGDEKAPILRERILSQKDNLAARGLRVLAFAEGEIDAELLNGCEELPLVDLTFLGLVGMQDPVRPEVPEAISNCRSAGIEVVMITGDDPKTAGAIAKDAGLDYAPGKLATGDDVRRANDISREELDRLTSKTRIYARVEPTQKLSIVLSLARNGHFVAVTGDGVNDAPALKHAHVGVAMGQKGTEVARESADIILADDNFSSIVEGIRQGRVAYANIRKVIFLLISTGASEVVLFLLAMPLGLALPLLPVQLLWLNLVTNGVQDVALACERAEGDELSYPPRKPKEPIFDHVMLRRILQSVLVMGVGGFIVYYWLLTNGYAVDNARNMLLLLFVLFENVQVFNARSERHSVFRQSLFSNPFLVLSVIGAQALHISAMYIPYLSDILGVEPMSVVEWLPLVLVSLLLLAVMELEKHWDRGRT